MTIPGHAELQTLTRLTQEAESALGLIDMTTVRLAKLFESGPTRRAHVAPGPGGDPAGWVAVRVDGCTGALIADHCVFAGAPESVRTNVADALIDHARRMSTEIVAVSGTSEPVPLRFEVPRSDEGFRRELEARGARVIDTLARLRADIIEVLRLSPEVPANVQIRRVETDRDFAAHHHIRNTGYGQLPHDRLLTLEQWRDQLCDEPGSAPESWLLATVDGEPVGMLAASLSRAELGAVYIAHAATLPQARGSRCNYALNQVALNWGLAQGLTRSRSRCRADEILGAAVGEVNSRGYEVVDYLDVWQMRAER